MADLLVLTHSVVQRKSSQNEKILRSHLPACHNLCKSALHQSPFNTQSQAQIQSSSRKEKERESTSCKVPLAVPIHRHHRDSFFATSTTCSTKACRSKIRSSQLTCLDFSNTEVSIMPPKQILCPEAECQW